MTQCWPEGALRAYLDGELPADDMQRVAAHLGDCTACDGLCTELSARAAHVSALLELLPEWGAAMPGPASPARAPHRRRSWAGIALALAAGLALAAYLLPDRHPREAVVHPAPAPAPPLVAAAVAETAPAPAGPAVPATTRRPRRARQTKPEPAYFVALDDEPFESGVIMRVDVKPGNVQADIVFGPDGRARAFRLVNAISKGEYR
jgi:anti-sigma factor RsiW